MDLSPGTRNAPSTARTGWMSLSMNRMRGNRKYWRAEKLLALIKINPLNSQVAETTRLYTAHLNEPESKTALTAARRAGSCGLGYSEYGSVVRVQSSHVVLL